MKQSRAAGIRLVNPPSARDPAAAALAGFRFSTVLLITLFIPAVLLGRWINFPLGTPLRGFSFALLAYKPGAGFTVMSHGVVIAVLLSAAAFRLWYYRPATLCLAGSTLILVSLVALIQVGLLCPGLLRDLASEAAQARAATAFETSFLPPNPGTEPERVNSLVLDTISSRLESGWQFLGLGWYATILSGFIVLRCGLAGLEQAARRRFLLNAALACLAVIVVLGARPCAAQMALARGYRAEALGEASKAVRAYRWAMRLDAWNAMDTDLYARIGAIDALHARTLAIEYRIYHAEFLAYDGDLPSGARELEGLIVSAPALAPVLRRRVAELWATYGLTLYRTAAFGQAVSAWQQARASDPSLWLAAFYLASGEYAVGRYQDAADLTGRVIAQVRDPVLRANLYSDMGDSLTMLGRYEEAHLAYRDSYKWDYIANRRALGVLVGP